MVMPERSDHSFLTSMVMGGRSDHHARLEPFDYYTPTVMRK
jgi:hypothetical protein